MENFDNWLSENQTFDKHFVECVRLALDERGIEYDIHSSELRLKNGTVELQLKGGKSFDEALKEWNIILLDFKTYENYNVLRKQLTDPGNNPSNRDFAKYIIYSRGGIRTPGASSDNVKFSSSTALGIDEGINNMLKHHKLRIIDSCTRWLKEENFMSFKKGYDIDLSKVKNLFDNVALTFFNNLKGKNQKMFEQLVPNLSFLMFIAYANKSQLHMQTGSTVHRFTVELRITDYYGISGFSFHGYSNWKIGRTPEAGLKFIMSTHLMCEKDGHYDYEPYESVKTLVEEKDLPRAFIKIAKILSVPNDLDFKSIHHTMRGSLAASRFGL